MNPVIETTGLTRLFGSVRAVDGLDLRVEAGKFFGFLGPNGAGKSTTIKMLTGLLAPTSGRMRILGEDLANEDRARGAAARELIAREPPAQPEDGAKLLPVHISRRASLIAASRPVRHPRPR